MNSAWALFFKSFLGKFSAKNAIGMIKKTKGPYKRPNNAEKRYNAFSKCVITESKKAERLFKYIIRGVTKRSRKAFIPPFKFRSTEFPQCIFLRRSNFLLSNDLQKTGFKVCESSFIGNTENDLVLMYVQIKRKR